MPNLGLQPDVKVRGTAWAFNQRSGSGVLGRLIWQRRRDGKQSSSVQRMMTAAGLREARGGPLKESGLVLGSRGPGSRQLGRAGPQEGRNPGRPAEGAVLPVTVAPVRLRRGPPPPGKFHAEISTAADCKQSQHDAGLLSGKGAPTVPAPTGGLPALPPLRPSPAWLPGCSGTSSPSAKRHQACPGQERKELLLVRFLILFEAVTTGEGVRGRGNAIFSRLHGAGATAHARSASLTPARGKPPASPGTAGGTAGPGTGRGPRSFPSPSVETGRGGRAVCGIGASTHSLTSGPRTLASFRVHTTCGGCFTEETVPRATHLSAAELGLNPGLRLQSPASFTLTP